MNHIRKTAILALVVVMALSTIAVASASTSKQAEEPRGLFGTFVKMEGTLLTVLTKDGEVTVEVAEDAEFKAPGTSEGLTLDDLTTEDKLAIQLVQRDGVRVVIRIMRMPGQPTNVHRVEVVVSEEGSTLTVTDKDGNTRVIDVPQETAQNIVGQVVTSINRELRNRDGEIEREAQGVVRAERIKEKLEAHLEKVGGQQSDDDGNAEERGREVERRIAHLKQLQEQSISILERLAEEAPEQAKEALDRALELATKSKEISNEVIKRVKQASIVELGKVKGVIEAIDVDAATIDVAFENGTVVTVRIADEGKIIRDDESIFLEDLGVGDVIVRAAYNPENFTAHVLVIRTPEGDTGESPDGDTAIHLRELLKGFIKEIDLANNTIQISSSGTGPEGSVSITADTEIEKNGEPAGIDGLVEGDFVLAVLDPQSGNALRLVVRSEKDVEKPEEIERHRKVSKGHVVSIHLEDRSITIRSDGDDKDDGDEELTVSVTENTRIVRSGRDGSLLREFAAGDTLLHLVYDVETMDAIMIVVDARVVNRPDVEILKMHGVIKSLDAETRTITFVTNRGTVEVTVSQDTEITRGGEVIAFSALEPRDVVTAEVNTETKTILSLEVRGAVSITPLRPQAQDTDTAEPFEIKGVIRGLDLDTRTLALATREGSHKFHVADDAEIEKDGEAIRFQDLVLGNIVEVEVSPENRTILSIEVKSAQTLEQERPEARDTDATIELKGIVKNVELSSHTLVILTPEGQGKFTVTDETEIHKNGEEADLDDLHRGDELWVKVNRGNRTILEMEVFSAASATTLEPVRTDGTSGSSASNEGDAAAVVVVKGVIEKLDIESGTIALVIEKGTVELHVTDRTSIFKDGEKSSLEELEVRDRVWAAVRLEGRVIVKMEVRSPDDDSATRVRSTNVTTTSGTDSGSSGSTTTTSNTGDSNSDTAVVTKVNGTIEAVYPDSNTLVIISDDGAITLIVTRETTILKDGVKSTLSDLNPRDIARASMTQKGHEVLDMVVESAEPTTTAKSDEPTPSGEPATTDDVEPTRTNDTTTTDDVEPTPTATPTADTSSEASVIAK